MENNLKEIENFYRPVNYWGWIDKLNSAQTEFQIDELQKAGYGGFILHARGNLRVPYMGDEWKKNVLLSIQEAKRRNMTVLIDDEYGWPSGFGAGKVPQKGIAYQLKWLCFKTISPEDPLRTDRYTLGIYDENYKRISDADIPTRLLRNRIPGETLFLVSYGVNPYYSDNLNDECVKSFIEESYEEYAKLLHDDFSSVAAFFSDEPQLAREHTPWSFGLRRKFAEKYGEELADFYPCLFRDVLDHKTARYRYFSLISQLFTENYAKQILQWCHEHRTLLCGHTTYEEDFYYQMQCSGSTMRFYSFMDWPGMDWLWREEASELNILQLTSVSEQCGKERCFSESYGTAGWNISFEDRRWIADKQFALGINLLGEHLGLYSLHGSCKREYPASLFFQQPWWKDSAPAMEYFSRISECIAVSQHPVSVLVLHPIKSAFLSYKSGDNSSARNVQDPFEKLTKILLRLGYPFHYGDEDHMKDAAEVTDNRLRIGFCAYSVVIIPPCETLDEHTFDLFTAFRANGGHLICFGQKPERINGILSERCKDFFQDLPSVPLAEESLEAELARLGVRNLHIRQSDQKHPVYIREMVREDRKFYFLVNTSREDCRIRLTTASGNSLQPYSLENGIFRNEILKSGSEMSLAGTQSLLLFETKAQPTIHADQKWRNERQLRDFQLAVPVENHLCLDYCRFSFDGATYSEPVYILDLQEKMLKEAINRDVYMKFEFENQCDSELSLGLEDPKVCEIFWNGARLSFTDAGFRWDPAIRVMHLPKSCRGYNEIVIKRSFWCSERTYFIKNSPGIHEAETNRITVETELEAIYLLGSFEVETTNLNRSGINRSFFVGKPFVLKPLRIQHSIDNLALEGFPFFAGELTLQTSFHCTDGKKYRIRFQHPDAIVTKISINGKDLPPYYWAPFNSEITEYIYNGENQISVTLVHSLRNLLGPHHVKAGELYAVAPLHYLSSFLQTQNQFEENYCLVPFGIEQGIFLDSCEHSFTGESL